ncbi:hypothetical protein [Kitasatospora sp. NPDC006786]|uniref:hypothetical protein n=1 Tax=unclassified Kitasatospora TaxID=2633591 RepID=UPI0033D58A98
MTTETTTTAVEVDVRSLPADSFTESDRARIDFAHKLAVLAVEAENVLATLCTDEAVSGDYAVQAAVVQALALHGVVAAAVTAERVRGTSWECIGKPFHLDAEEAETKWGPKAGEWRSRTKVQSDLVRNPGQYLDYVDRHLATGATATRSKERRKLSSVIDAAASVTGRDVAAADRAFAGQEVCSHCHR